MPFIDISTAPPTDGTWSGALPMWRDRSFNISVRGTFVGTVTLQRCNYDADSTVNTNWFDVSTYTTPIEENGYTGGKAYYRIGIKNGAYTSGTATVGVSI